MPLNFFHLVPNKFENLAYDDFCHKSNKSPSNKVQGCFFYEREFLIWAGMETITVNIYRRVIGIV